MQVVPGGAGLLVHNEAQRGGELGDIALGCQEMIISGRSDEENGTSPKLRACKTLAGVVGNEGAELIMDEEDEAYCVGEIGRQTISMTGRYRRLFALIGLS